MLFQIAVLLRAFSTCLTLCQWAVAHQAPSGQKILFSSLSSCDQEINKNIISLSIKCILHCKKLGLTINFQIKLDIFFLLKREPHIYE